MLQQPVLPLDISKLQTMLPGRVFPTAACAVIWTRLGLRQPMLPWTCTVQQPVLPLAVSVLQQPMLPLIYTFYTVLYLRKALQRVKKI